MFAPYCPRHRCQVLLTTRRIRSLSNLGKGVIAVGWSVTTVSGSCCSPVVRSRRPTR